MAIFDIPVAPEYKEELRKLEPTDPASAVLFNELFGQMIENDAYLKKEIARRMKMVFITKAEYDERLSAYQSDSTYIDPDSEVLFAETIYYISDDYDELVRNAVHIEYTDTYALGVTNVQGVIDKLINRIVRLESKVQ